VTAVHHLEKVPAKGATETEVGNIQYYSCSSCGECYIDEKGKEPVAKADTIIPVTKSTPGWHQFDGVWFYYKADGSLLTNGWAKDSTGWMWMNGSGKITKSQWIKDGGSWYYLKANGYMATGTQTINGKTYRFASSGKWID
jgi:hypothetical protein